MSDDFDKLRPKGDEDDSEDESLDWQKDKPKKSGEPSSGENLGFTGELSWRADVEDAFDEQLKAANEDAFDWQQRQQPQSGSSSSGSGLGFTGQLDWKKTQPGGDESSQGEQNDSLDWLKNVDEGETPEAEIDPFADMPAAQETSSTADEDDPLAWMNQYGDDLVNEEPAEAEASFFDDEDDELFATPASQIDSPPEQDDPLSWLNQFSAADDAPAEPAAPSWLDDSEADAADIDSGVDVPSWLSDAAPVEKPITEGGKLSADWLAGAEDAPETSESEMDFDQWQSLQNEMTRPRDIEEEMPDLFSQFGDAPAVSDADLPVKETGELPSWVLGMEDLNADDAPDWLTDSQPAAPQSLAAPLPNDIFAELGLDNSEPESSFEFPEPEVDDLLAGLNLGGASDVPDWLNESAPAAPTPSAAPSASDDIFGELGLPTPETGYDFLDQPEQEDDLLAGLNLGGASDSPNWFTEVDEPVAKDTPDWLSDLGDLSESAQAQTMDVRSGAVPAEDDFLAELRGDIRQPAAEIDPMDTSGLQDIDSLLASYDSAPSLPSTGELMGSSADLDRLLSENEMEQISSRRGGEARPSPGVSGLSPDAPDWLTELGANVDEVSAAAIVRKQTQRERPLDELSDRLQALHDRGLDLPTSEDAKPSEVLRTLLPGVTEVLSAAPLQVTTGNLIGDLVLTDAQRQKMNLLKTLVGTEEDVRPAGQPSAIDLTLATPNLADLGVDEEPDFGVGSSPQPEPAPVSRRPKRRRLPKFDRILIGFFVAAAVILPYVVSSLRIGDLPPAQFAAGSREQAVFDQVASLGQGDLALIAAEYGPTGAGELDPALDALLRHVLLRGARPIIVSGNPVGLLHASNVLNELTGDAVFLNQLDQPALQANQDYYVVRYLAASTIGLRAFSQDITGMLALDATGQATNLRAASLQDFDLIAVVAESAEEIRGWAEQIAPLAGQPIVAVTGQSAAPLSEPYVLPNSPEKLTGLGGLLVGYRDAYTYRTMLDAGFSGGAIPLAPAIDTPTPEATEETPVAPTATVEGGVVEVTSEVVETDVVTSPTPEDEEATNTPPPTSTPEPSNTPAPTATPTDRPTATLTPSVTPTFEPALEVRGVIDSDQAVNVREGPGRTFAPIASLTPGTIVQITGRNGDGTWLKILLEDGSEGWVSASLVAVEEGEASQTRLNVDLSSQTVGLMSDVIFYAPALQDEATPEVTAEADVESTAEATAEATVEPTVIPPTPIVAVSPPTNPYRAERWYGMTLGLVAIIVVITIGMIANIVRSLFRRGK